MVFRSYKDIISDNLLLLYVISKSTHLGRTKLQKLVYLIECIFSKKKIKTFNYNFKRWDYGPFTKEIFEDSESLVENHIIIDQTTQLSNRGKEILEQSKEIFDDNKDLIDEIDKIIDKYDKLDFDELIKAVYNSKVEINGEFLRVEDVPMGTFLKTRISEESEQNKLNITEEWFETLDIILDSEFYDSLNKAAKEAETDQSYSYDEVFSDV